MAIIYRMVQDGRRQSPTRGKWFARAVNMGTVETEELAAVIERNCTVKRSDVMAVLTELGEVVRQQLESSHRVRLKGIGTLMAGLRGPACDHPEDCVPSMVGDQHVCFTPDKELRLRDCATLPLP